MSAHFRHLRLCFAPVMPSHRPLRLLPPLLLPRYNASFSSSTFQLQRNLKRYSTSSPSSPRTPPPNSYSPFLRVSPEVREAVSTKKPVVALETTIYTHGYPYPSNIALASRLESLVRTNGGVPATIGVVDGVATVGMREEEIVQLCSSVKDGGDEGTWKVSRRDLGFILGGGLVGNRRYGGTTIAGTMVLAHLAGIRIFATGGLGGVHHDGQFTLDISADLTELGRTPVAVISSGCKAFLDIPRTLEYLETQGVGVGTFLDGREEGAKVDFPAFFTRDSGVQSPKVIRDEVEAAAIVFAQMKLPLGSGLVLANPAPAEVSLAKEQMAQIISKAVEEAEQHGMSGARNTPYVLRRIKELTGGKSEEVNRALIESNVVRGTKVAVELTKMELKSEVTARDQGQRRPETEGVVRASVPSSLSTKSPDAKNAARFNKQATKEYDIVVAGSLISDTISDYTPYPSSDSPITPVPQTSNPSQIKQSAGGVGRNVATAAHYAGSSVLLTSAVADDLAGDSLLASLRGTGMSVDGVTVLPSSSNSRTAQYLAINNANKDLHLAMSDTSILDHPSLASADLWSSKLTGSDTFPKWVVIDANWSPNVLSTIISTARSLPSKPKLAFEPVSTAKASRLVATASSQPVCSNHSSSLLTPFSTYPTSHPIDLIAPNALELSALYSAFQSSSLFTPTSSTDSTASPWWRIIDAFALPSTGSRARFEAIAGPELTDAGIPQRSLQLLPYVPCVVTKLGEQGCLLTRIVGPDEECLRDPEQARWIVGRAVSEEARETLKVGGVYMRLFPPAENVVEGAIRGVNGVGDTLLGVLIAGLVRSGKTVEDILPVAQTAAVETLKSEEAVGEGVKRIRPLLQNGPG